jgi:hypothetical protein
MSAAKEISECFLPEKYEYKFTEAEYLHSSAPESFRANFFVKDIENEAQFGVWFEEFKKKTQTDWIVSKPKTAFSGGKKAQFAFGKNQILKLLINLTFFILFSP